MEVLSVHVPVSNGYILYRGILFRSSFKTFSAHWNAIHFLVATVISARNLLPSRRAPFRCQLLAKAAIRNLARRKQRDAGNGEPHIRAIFRFLKREFKYDSPGNNQAARNQNGLEKT